MKKGEFIITCQTEKFNIGDYVVIKYDCKTIEPSKKIYFDPDMEQFYGERHKILRRDHRGENWYVLEDVYSEDGYSWIWDANWLELDNGVKIQPFELEDSFYV